MARLRNKTSGVVVEVRDEKVERLGAEWEPVDKPKPTKSAASKSAKK